MVELREVTRRFGSVIALDGVSLRVEPGEVVVMRGASGSGKTTLLRLVAGLLSPDAGEIRLDGETASGPGRLLPPWRRRLAMVFQEPRLWPHMTVRQNLSFALSALPRGNRRERLEKVSRQTGILDLWSRYPGDLSVGQARRVALARALAPGRPLILMDEPLTNLDADGRRELVRVIRQFHEDERFALLYVTHDAAEEGLAAQRTISLEKGRIVSGGS